MHNKHWKKNRNKRNKEENVKSLELAPSVGWSQHQTIGNVPKEILLGKPIVNNAELKVSFN